MGYPLAGRRRATPTVATVLLPAERSRVDAAGTGVFTVLHRESIPDAIRAVREREIEALLVSAHRCPPDQVPHVATVVRNFPAVTTAVLVSRHEPGLTDLLLRLGASGVQQVVDVTSPAGWARLRQLASTPATRAVAAIQAPLLEALAGAGAPPDVRLFFEAMVRLAAQTRTVRALTHELRVEPSTLMSRFTRVGLPSPKCYLAAIRLLHAAHLFEGAGLSIADVAYRLEFSSPQSFGRHVRATLGITASEFRRRFPFPAAMDRFLATMVQPYRPVWAGFHPLRPPAQRS